MVGFLSWFAVDTLGIPRGNTFCIYYTKCKKFAHHKMNQKILALRVIPRDISRRFKIPVLFLVPIFLLQRNVQYVFKGVSNERRFFLLFSAEIQIFRNF